MKTMCPPGYHHNGFVATHALGHDISEHNISDHKWSTKHKVLKSQRSKMSVIYMQSWKQCALPVITTMALWKHDVQLHIAGTIGYTLLVPSCFSEIWALCVSWITYGHLYYTPCLTCWALFGSLVPAICNHTSWPETTFDN